MPKGEFENRDRDESHDLGNIPLAGPRHLGELSEDIAEERGDLRTYSIDPGRANHPDLFRAAEGRAAEKGTGLGSPLMDYTVRSVYDSRPNSGRDFNQWFSSEAVDLNHTPNDFTALRKCFFVPRGWVAIIRKVSFRISPTSLMDLAFSDPGNPAWYDALLSVLVNGANVDPEQFPIGSSTATSNLRTLGAIPVRDGDDITTWAIADEGFSVGVAISNWATSTLGASVASQPHINIGFYGNLLLKTGRPAMFEPSNLGGKSPTAVTASPRDLGPISSGEDLVANKRRKIPFKKVPILRK